MKWLSAGLTFINVMTVCGLLGGLAAHGLNKTVAICSAIVGLLAALLAFFGTSSPVRQETPDVTARKQGGTIFGPAARRYRSLWLWVVVAVFAMFAFRSFCNVFFIDGNEYKIQNPNNLGDLSLHITYIKNFANGVSLWPDNPIYVFSKLRYPVGVDLFNALLVVAGIDLIRGLVWMGLLSSAALCYALYRWGGAFTIAGFLFNGGLVGFQWFKAYEWKDYQSVNYIAWKSLALTMLVTQRGLLYALPVGLLLLYHWRAKFFPPGQPNLPEIIPAPRPPSEPEEEEPEELASSESEALSTSEVDALSSSESEVLSTSEADALSSSRSEALSSSESDALSSSRSEALSSSKSAVLSASESEVVSAPESEVLSASEPEVVSASESKVPSSFEPEVSSSSESSVLAPSQDYDASREAAAAWKPPRGPLPFWVELTLYGTMPLFHLHTFMALSVVLVFLFFFLNPWARKHLAMLVGGAFLPATFFVWLITDHFQAGSVMRWNPGWVQNNGDFARPLAAFASQAPTTPAAPTSGFFGTLTHFVEFWVVNFGLTIPLIIALLVLVIIHAWKRKNQAAPVRIRVIGILAGFALVAVVLVSLIAYLSFGSSAFVSLALVPPVTIAVLIPLFASVLQRDRNQAIPVSVPFAFVIPAVALFIFACLVKTAPWEWDNIKLIIWSYLIVLPFVWSELVSRWVFPVRAVVCAVLFGSGFFTLFGGLAAGRTGYGMADRAEVDAVGVAVKQVPIEARFAAYPTYNHPLLLQGRKLIIGYPGHVWTQGFDFGPNNAKLDALMNGAPDWKETARFFKARYLFWGREEKLHYPQSKHPWEQESKLVASGPWGAIYDIESPRDASSPAPQGQ